MSRDVRAPDLAYDDPGEARVPELSSIIEVELPSGDVTAVMRRRFGASDGLRVALVAGIRGDAPEGIRIAHAVMRFLESYEEKLNGIVDVYPCANPLAAHRSSRLWPFFDVDLNRLFPGRSGGHPPDRVAHAICQDIRGADQVVELRGARAAFREAPQALVRHRDLDAAKLAAHANVAVVWRRRPGPAAASTFAHQFPGTIVLEGGTGNRLTAGIGEDLSDGVLNLLATLGLVGEADLPFHWAGLRRPLEVDDEQVLRVRAERGGLFLPAGEAWRSVAAGEVVGTVVDPVTGELREEVRSPADAHVLAIRELPVVFPGTMVARVVTP
ncbi:MAG: succinylglutamate desuccinylase/aspartoacylase family protein [Myxococcota bacterium]|nr:succinylglutamate desuccinylase/aspartoacylase family protein [Myxococcota bacterium]